MSFNDSVQKYSLKDKGTSNMKIYQVLSSIGIYNVDTHLRDGPFSRDIGIFNLHPSKGTQWVVYINESFFHSYGCSPPRKLPKFNIKRNALCLYSENLIQGLSCKRDPYCASYCLYTIYSKKVIGVGFKTAVLNLYYQMIQQL